MAKLKLSTLIKRRNDAYIKNTTKILERLEDNVFPAVVNLVGNDVGERLEWRDAVLVGNVLIIAAAVVHKVGEVIMTAAGEKVMVTEENKSELDRIMRIGIPVDIAQNATAEQVFKFLKAEELKAGGSDSGISDDNILLLAHDEHEFSFDDLTTEQVEELMLHEMGVSKGKIH